MNIGYIAGLSFGIIFGIVLAIVLFVVANSDHKIKSEYDERQQALRGKAYRYAFYSMIVVEAFLLVVDMSKMELPVENYVLHFAGIIIGGMVLATYSVFHDVYWGMNNNKKRYIVLFIALTVLNALPVIGAARAGDLIENGKLGVGGVNIAVLIMMGVLLIELMIKHVMDNKKEESED